jgi:EamA domain-containing membrane protein RarD
MRVVLELIRIIVIFGILGIVFSAVVNYVYQAFDITEYRWLGYIAILLLLFVTYRNKWQFSGWYKGEKTKLSRTFTNVLISFSILLFVIPTLFTYLL